MKVRILLDVDGVLNAVPGRTKDWDDWKAGYANQFFINWSETVARTVRRWADTPGVEVMWLTTWTHEANRHICPLLDLPQFKVAGEMPPLQQFGWWKFEIARELWESDPVPFVWIDDDLGDLYDDGAADWVRSLSPNAMGIRPDHRKGLTQRLLDEVDRFIEEKTCQVVTS
jgi:phage terminase large subunit-like protein